jgi:general secretion pathway protein F
MPVFVYEAVDKRGKKVSAKREAPDRNALKEALKKEGWIPLHISLYRPSKLDALIHRITTKDILIFTQELADLLEAGLPLDKAIFILSQHSEKEQFREILSEIYRDIQRGQSLSQALSTHKCFPKLYVNMVKAAETGGILEPVLRRLALFMETTTQFKEDVISAMVYPLLLTFVGSLAVGVLMIYVIPRFANIFKEMGEALPLPTLLLLYISSFISKAWWIVLILLVIGVYFLKKYSQTPEGKKLLDSARLKLPILSRLQLKIYISRFSRTMGTLLKSGVPVLSAIRIAREVTGNEIVSEKLKILEEGVRKGQGITVPLRESKVFPEVVLQMVAVGEEAGRLEETFLHIAERYEAETRSMIKRLVSFIEPAIILVMGIFVGFIVISMLLAIFSINEIPL